MSPKSPFIIVENFLSQLLCEEIIDTVDFPEPIQNDQGRLTYTYTKDAQYQEIIYEKVRKIIPQIEQHFEYKHKLTEAFKFEYLPLSSLIEVHAENAELIDKKWVRTKARDFTAVIFLSQHNAGDDNFDDAYEVQGGNLEFVNHDFSIHPTPGTMVVFPSDPRFANASSQVVNGEGYQIRFHLSGEQPFIYDPKQFPGDYRTWF